MTRFVHALIAGVVIAGATGSAAFAGTTEKPYWPMDNNSVETSSDLVAPGEAVTVSFSGFEPFSMVTITLEQTESATAMGSSVGPLVLSASSSKTFTEQADGQGVVRLDVTLPEGGTYTVQAEGVDPSGAPRVLSTQVEAAARDAGSASGATPDGGPSPVLLLALGAAFAATAAGATLVVRRRSPEPQPS